MLRRTAQPSTTGALKDCEMHPYTIQLALRDEVHHRRDLEPRDKRSTYVEAHATETRMQLEPLEKETFGQRQYFCTHEIIFQYVATFVLYSRETLFGKEGQDQCSKLAIRRLCV